MADITHRDGRPPKITAVALDPTQHGIACWLAGNLVREVARLLGQRDPPLDLLSLKTG